MTRKLLVADDSVTIQRVVHLAFAGEDVQIEAVSSGELVVEAARNLKPDIIFADVFMPGCNGYEVCEQIKADPMLKTIPVVLMVGTFEPFDPNEAARVRSNGCLTKPFDTNELLQIFNDLVTAPPAPVVPEPASVREESQAAAMHAPPRRSVLTLDPPLSERTRASFLGPQRVLELFTSVAPAASTGWSLPESPPSPLPREIVRTIVDGVIRQISPEIVREVAWEVIPELSEMLIRQKMNENPEDNSLRK